VNDSATIVVTAQDSTTTTYKVNFLVAPISLPILTGIIVSGLPATINPSNTLQVSAH
jgi:hypothetical protein